MATLIAPLAAGIAGAGDGTAEFYRRGTTTPVVVYADPDATAPVGKTVDLDENGGWTDDDGYALYAAESVFVRVRSSLGVVVREFVVVVDDISVDVQSASFTGTLPSGSQGAGGAVDLRTVLDRWVDSGGALDWKVRRSGAAADETLADALDSVLVSNQPLFSVRAYGAVGDGLTDDYPAFVAAYNAAVAFGGGIIFLPAGNYLLASAFSITSQRVSILGAGAAGSIITSALAAGVAVTINAGASTFSGAFIQGITITNSVAGANVTPLQVVSTPGLILREVMIKQHALAVDIRSRVALYSCDFTVPTSATAGDYVVAFTSNAADSVILGGSFTNSKTANAGAIHVSVANMLIQGAKVDISALTGARYGILIDTSGGTRVDGCDIVSGDASTVGLNLGADVSCFESNNIFSGSGTSFSHGGLVTSATTQVIRGSRAGKYATTAVADGASYTPSPPAEINEYTWAGAGAGAITILRHGASVMGEGARLILRFRTTSTGQLTITFAVSGAGIGYYALPAPAALAAGRIRQYEFAWTFATAVAGWTLVGATPSDYAP